MVHSTRCESVLLPCPSIRVHITDPNHIRDDERDTHLLRNHYGCKEPICACCHCLLLSSLSTLSQSTTDSSTESSTYTSSASASGTQTVSRTATFSSSPSFVMTSPYYNKGLSQGGVAGVVLGVIGISASCVVGVWCRYQREKDARRAARANERRLRAVEKEAKRRQRKVDITPDVGPLRLTVPEGLQPEQEVRSRTYLAPSTANPSGLHSSDRLDHDTADDDRLSTGFPEVELVSPDAADRTPTRRLRPQPAIRSAMRKSEGSIKSNATSTSPARSPYPSAPATSTPSKPRTAERSPVSVGRKQRRYEMTGNPNIV